MSCVQHFRKPPCTLQPAYVDATFNPSTAGDEVSFGVFLKNAFSRHSVFIQAATSNVFSVLQVEAMGLLLGGSAIKQGRSQKFCEAWASFILSV